jgi:hypothetical protein
MEMVLQMSPWPLALGYANDAERIPHTNQSTKLTATINKIRLCLQCPWRLESAISQSSRSLDLPATLLMQSLSACKK